MDLMIKNGDIVTDASGEAVYVENTDELMQRVLICIGIAKGSFIYNKELGLERPLTLDSARDKKRLETLLKEAIMPIDGANIELIDAELAENNGITAELRVKLGEEERTVEVTI